MSNLPTESFDYNNFDQAYKNDWADSRYAFCKIVSGKWFLLLNNFAITSLQLPSSLTLGNQYQEKQKSYIRSSLNTSGGFVRLMIFSISMHDGIHDRNMAVVDKSQLLQVGQCWCALMDGSERSFGVIDGAEHKERRLWCVNIEHRFHWQSGYLTELCMINANKFWATSQRFIHFLSLLCKWYYLNCQIIEILTIINATIADVSHYQG